MSAIWKYSWVVAFVEKIILLVWRFVALSFISCTTSSQQPHHASQILVFHLHALYTLAECFIISYFIGQVAFTLFFAQERIKEKKEDF